MALTLNSPGVFLNENDSSQVTQGPITVGAAILGPTVKGPVNIPTVVTTYSQFKNIFGTTFNDVSGTTQEYLTSIAAYNYFQQGGASLVVARVVSGTYTPAVASISGSIPAFSLETLSPGVIMNNSGSAGASGSLGVLGTADNIRWEITSANSASGEFSLNIRQGNDYDNKKTVLESWSNLSLDPNSPNYVEYVIGNQTQVPSIDGSGNWYLQTVGSYPNQSKYVRIKSVEAPTPNYLNALGQARTEYTASIPVVGTGTQGGAFTGATGDIQASVITSMFGNIPTAPGTPIQGVGANDYTASLSLLANKDDYAYNVIFVPGLTSQNAPSQVATLINNTQNRGDAIAVVDLVGYNQPNVTTVTSKATTIDSSYAAAYYPWLQLRSVETGKLLWCPASTVVPAAYEYNDKVGQPWFAPAGINRGALPTVVQPERRLSSGDRDALYQGKVNPIAVFPGQGTVIYGQKTLQSANSALNRVNVRRLLIELKQNINQVAAGLLFEPNTTATRNSFLNQVNPYLSYVQQKQGLYAFQVVMDETNNTADVIDRNQLVGAIYLQPTKTSEFIIVDFNITPTGATFGA